MLLVEDPINLFYHTGMQLSAGSLLGDDLFVDGRYIQACREAGREARPIGELREALPGTVEVDSAVMSAARVEELRSWGLEVQLKPLLLQQQRAVKRTDELEKMRLAAALATAGYEFAYSQLREGVTERKTAGALQAFWFSQGGAGASFEPIVAFGPNTALPHHHPGDRELKRGDLVLFDLGVQLANYQSDMTRVVAFRGELPEIYTIVREAQRRALAELRAGVTVGAVDRAARGYITEQGYGDYFPHRLGHGLGLEVHEWPMFRDENLVLETGMTITVEPGVYLPGKYGVRWEDAVLVTESGYERLAL